MHRAVHIHHSSITLIQKWGVTSQKYPFLHNLPLTINHTVVAIQKFCREIKRQRKDVGIGHKKHYN